uniref:(northern house mosquito) hypothetical protein n=1 Tax=Culex pipiens TaxID=7175 RepID=A0A8D8KMJ0_CULPI
MQLKIKQHFITTLDTLTIVNDKDFADENAAQWIYRTLNKGKDNRLARTHVRKTEKNTQYKILYIFEILFIYLYIKNVKKISERKTHTTQKQALNEMFWFFFEQKKKYQLTHTLSKYGML